MNKSSTVLEVSELSCSIGASLARDELELHHYLSRARASFFFSSEVAYYIALHASPSMSLLRANAISCWGREIH